MNTYEEAMKRLDEQIGNKDGLFALSTISQNKGPNGACIPAARLVDAYYEEGALYIVTHAKSNKMLEIAENPEVAICVIVENFTANGKAENLGWVLNPQNEVIIEKLRQIFAEWYYVANNEADENCCIMKVTLTKGLWYDAHEGTRTEIDFINKTVV
ncbi:pyridoxamine 5-phosphate oxidase [Erysipelothrix larvae]|uniref:Pyridoxamine 5-phosphate oxidase n=1 Tax=Erysipelothrix larvae TaxID=1514105 RepID=A0A109UHR6_9FIRM|nr:pyridoxamine 5-phosphate oxidase [Erysipelothrix larvae]